MQWRRSRDGSMSLPVGPRPKGVRLGVRYWTDDIINPEVPQGPQVSSGFPLLPSLLAGGLPIIGGLIQNIMANRQAERQMDFQREMSNTAYSRAARDMRRAGINPLLGFQGPASSPQGAQAQIGNMLAEGPSNAIAMRQQQLNLARLMLDSINSASLRGLRSDQAGLARASAGLTRAKGTSARQQANFDEWVGTLGPAARFVVMLINALRS